MASSSTLPDHDGTVYTSCYCEENIYLLIKRFLKSSGCDQRWDVFSVFISNPRRTVGLWNQQMATSKDAAIIWDYHVVLALRERPQVDDESLTLTLSRERGARIYDLDTNLPVPCHWKKYADQTFPLGTDTPKEYQRVVPGEVYLDNFASDRSHMLVSDSSPSGEIRYHSQPPPYPVICGSEAEKNDVRHNLMTHFVSMTERGFGTVMDLDTFKRWCLV